MVKNKILVSANIGLGVSKTDDFTTTACKNNRKTTYAEVHDALTSIFNKYGQCPNIFAAQELGFLGFRPTPFFSRPVATDAKTLTNLNGLGRGVGIYSDNPNSLEFDTKNNQDEITAIIDEYKDKNNRISKIAIINVYRIQHKDYTRAISETVNSINEITRRLRNDHQIRKMIVIGDFNSEDNVYLQRGFREIKDPRNFHKHTAISRKTYIDRVFVNFDDVGFLDIFPSIERKRFTKNDEELGHKVYALWLGKKPGEIQLNACKTFTNKNLRKFIRENDPKFSTTLSDKIKNATSITEKRLITEQMAIEFTNKIQEYLKAVEKTVYKKSNHRDHVLVKQVDLAQDQMEQGKKPEKAFYSFVRGCQKGLEDSNDDTKPDGNSLSDKLNKKLKNLNKANLQKGFELIDEIYLNQNKCKLRWQNNIRDFGRAVSSTSNSGAMDAHGMSLKITKTFMKSNKFLARFKEIIDLLFETGYMPQTWKVDNIHFIYKRKGDRADPSNWRPITIAASLGKHVERIFSILISPMDDRNYQNHAYVKKRSCMTAIVAVQQHLLKIKNKIKNYNNKMWKFFIYL